MMRFKKWMILLAAVFLVGIWGYMVYDINQRFPNRENIACAQGESAGYKGVTMTAGEIEILSYDETLERYPELADAYDSLGDAGDENAQMEKQFSYIFVHVQLENTTDNKISFGKDSVLLWMVEADTQENGIDFFQFMTLNPDYTGSVDAHERLDVILPYGISLSYMHLSELKASDIKVVYSYYPTKNYLYYQSDMEES